MSQRHQMQLAGSAALLDRPRLFIALSAAAAAYPHDRPRRLGRRRRRLADNHQRAAIPPRSAQIDAPEPIPVTARIHWARDGIEQLDTTAVAWAGRAVLISVQDRRRQTLGVWLDAGGIQRRRALIQGNKGR
jgi:hypothetical protein